MTVSSSEKSVTVTIKASKTTPRYGRGGPRTPDFSIETKKEMSLKDLLKALWDRFIEVTPGTRMEIQKFDNATLIFECHGSCDLGMRKVSDTGQCEYLLGQDRKDAQALIDAGWQCSEEIREKFGFDA